MPGTHRCAVPVRGKVKKQTQILKTRNCGCDFGSNIPKEANKLKSPSRETKTSIQNLKKERDPCRVGAHRKWSIVGKGQVQEPAYLSFDPGSLPYQLLVTMSLISSFVK